MTVEVASPFTDHAVLQRDRPAAVWGRGAPGEPISVSFAGQRKATITAADGTWQVRLDAMPAAKEGRDLVISGATTSITLTDVVVGEVWFCGGQSNMEFRVRNCLNADAEMADASNHQLIRQLKVPIRHSASPESSFGATWTVATPTTVGDFTGIGYFFARELVQTLDVPIGLLNVTHYGTRVEPWTPPLAFRLVPALKGIADLVDLWDPTTVSGNRAYAEYLTKLKAWLPEAEAAIPVRKPLTSPPAAPVSLADRHQPTRLWNGMVVAMVPYTMRGFLWYQGEDNADEGLAYGPKLEALIRGWRQAFAQGDLPFYSVQLSAYQTVTNWPLLREAQRRTLASLPNTGMVVTIDVGGGIDIHPQNKQDVGQRLARLALTREYGASGASTGPMFRSMAIEDNAIRVSFDQVGYGLMTASKQGLAAPVPGGTLAGWQIAGADKQWHPATARIDGTTVLAFSPEVAAPREIRYAFASNPIEANLYNVDGLPAAPFSTDHG